MDRRKADYVFRYGGEEFLIVLPETSLERACEAAERLRKAVEAEAGGVTISLGVACLTESLQEKDQLIAAADRALYRAKENGRNRVEWIRESETRQGSTWPASGAPLPHLTGLPCWVCHGLPNLYRHSLAGHYSEIFRMSG